MEKLGSPLGTAVRVRGRMGWGRAVFQVVGVPCSEEKSHHTAAPPHPPAPSPKSSSFLDHRMPVGKEIKSKVNFKLKKKKKGNQILWGKNRISDTASETWKAEMLNVREPDSCRRKLDMSCQVIQPPKGQCYFGLHMKRLQASQDTHAHTNVQTREGSEKGKALVKGWLSALW